MCSGGDSKNNGSHTYFHLADELDRSAVAITSHVCTKWSSFKILHLLGWITPVKPGEFTCKLVQYFENLHFI